MAKKDAIFDYGAKFDTSSYLSGVQDDWDANKSNAINIRTDLAWRGSPAQSWEHSGSSPAEISGWEAGTWKLLNFYNLPVASYTKDFDAATWSHKLIYDIKQAFNLPNQETMSSWKNEYTVDAGEAHYFYWKKANAKPSMMSMSHSTAGGYKHSDNNPVKCILNIPISGCAYYGGDDNKDNITVWPTATNATTMNNHYTTLEDASTSADDWTDPTQVGSQFTQSSSCFLLNMEKL